MQGKRADRLLLSGSSGWEAGGGREAGTQRPPSLSRNGSPRSRPRQGGAASGRLREERSGAEPQAGALREPSRADPALPCAGVAMAPPRKGDLSAEEKELLAVISTGEPCRPSPLAAVGRSSHGPRWPCPEGLRDPARCGRPVRRRYRPLAAGSPRPGRAPRVTALRAPCLHPAVGPPPFSLPRRAAAPGFPSLGQGAPRECRGGALRCSGAGEAQLGGSGSAEESLHLIGNVC